VSTFVRPAAAVIVAVALECACLLAAGPAAAATCRTVQVQNAVPVGIALSPQQTTVAYGGCVQFIDQAFGPPVSITVAGGYHVTLNYGDNTSGKTNYSATSPGPHTVTADNGAATASGRITVGARPSPAPSPSRSPSPSSSPRPSPAASGSQSSGPQVARTPRRHHRSGSLPVPLGTPPPGPGLSPTPGVAPTVAGSPPGPLQSTTPAAVAVAGPLEPPSGRALGLPAALAALVLIGVGTAVVRVVMAEPAVDGRRSVGGTA
jgi:hypothetical protein